MSDIEKRVAELERRLATQEAIEARRRERIRAMRRPGPITYMLGLALSCMLCYLGYIFIDMLNI